MTEKEEISTYEYKTMLWVIWFFWFINTFLNLIILLNFLIAVISQVYDQTIAQKILNRYWDKANFNQEYFIVMNQFMQLSELFKIVVITQAVDFEDNTDDDSYVGFVESLKRIIHKQMVELKDSNFKNLKTIVDKFDERFGKMEQDINKIEDVQKEIVTVNTRLD